jgi:hypothetical protein
MLKPGQTPWREVLKASQPHHDSIEGLLRPPLTVAATFDVATYGNPRRGALVALDSSGVAIPIVLAEIGALVSGTTYRVNWAVSRFVVGTAVEVSTGPGTTAAVTVTAATFAQKNEDTGLVSGEDTVTFSLALPVGAELLLSQAGAGQPVQGVVYESSLSQNFSMALEIPGARADQIAGGNSAFVAGLPGVSVKFGAVFIDTKMAVAPRGAVY